ncbi:hypothetical protein NL676_024376 [Syzygium grande]|nr:hypothetical protein NL676_024376 [Syzygium grande]
MGWDDRGWTKAGPANFLDVCLASSWARPLISDANVVFARGSREGCSGPTLENLRIFLARFLDPPRNLLPLQPFSTNPLVYLSAVVDPYGGDR